MVARDGIEPPPPAFSGLDSAMASLLINLHIRPEVLLLRHHLLGRNCDVADAGVRLTYSATGNGLIMCCWLCILVGLLFFGRGILAQEVHNYGSIPCHA